MPGHSRCLLLWWATRGAYGLMYCALYMLTVAAATWRCSPYTAAVVDLPAQRFCRGQGDVDCDIVIVTWKGTSGVHRIAADGQRL